jgi:hypothetical protein
MKAVRMITSERGMGAILTGRRYALLLVMACIFTAIEHPKIELPPTL